MYSSRTPRKATGYLLKTCWSIESRLDTRNKEALQACLQASPNCECPIWRKPNTEEKQSFFEVAWTGQRNHRQACLQASPYCECPIWRKPNTEEKRSFFEVPGRVSGTIDKLACKRLLIASVQFGESQTPRKSEAFSRWPGRRSGRTNIARLLTMHTMFGFLFSKNIVFIYIL